MSGILYRQLLQIAKEQLTAVKLQLCEAAATAGWTGADLNRFELVLEEAVVNIMVHAYSGNSGELLVELHAAPSQGLLLILEDRGGLFDPTAMPPPDLASPLEERAIGGLGVHLMHSLSDGMVYRRDGAVNHLELSFRHRSSA